MSSTMVKAPINLTPEPEFFSMIRTTSHSSLVVPAENRNPSGPAWIRTAAAMTVASIIPGLCGCHAIPVYEQQYVSKPCMQFSDSPVFAYGSRALAQIEPGFAVSGGAQVTTCSACK